MWVKAGGRDTTCRKVRQFKKQNTENDGNSHRFYLCLQFLEFPGPHFRDPANSPRMSRRKSPANHETLIILRDVWAKTFPGPEIPRGPGKPEISRDPPRPGNPQRAETINVSCHFRHFRHALSRTYPTEKHCLVSLPPTSKLEYACARACPQACA